MIIESDNIYCGDCLELMKQMGDKSVNLIITDPPWNVGKDYGTYKDNLSYDKYTALIISLKREWNRIADGKVIIVLGSEILKQWWDVFPEAKIIIVKLGAIVLTRKKNMHLQWKAILTTCESNEFSTDLFENYWEDIRWLGEGYFFNEPRYGHPCMTPLKLMKRLCLMFSSENDLILDPFLGYGTTTVACIHTSRRYIGFEIDPTYFEIAKKRIESEKMQLKLDLK